MSSTELSAFSRQALSIRDEAVFWKPLIFAKDQMNRGQHWLNPVARLRAGLSIEQARGKLTALRATLNDVIYQKTGASPSTPSPSYSWG
jgi:hypothetical protein